MSSTKVIVSLSECELLEVRMFLPVFHTFKMLKLHYCQVFLLLNHFGLIVNEMITLLGSSENLRVACMR